MRVERACPPFFRNRRQGRSTGKDEGAAVLGGQEMVWLTSCDRLGTAGGRTWLAEKVVGREDARGPIRVRMSHFRAWSGAPCDLCRNRERS